MSVTEDRALSTLSKADLIAEIGKLQERAASKPTALPTAPESTALSDCIRALDRLKEYAANPGARTFGSPGSAMERVLKFLATKYGIEIVEVRSIPCARKHLDEVDTYALAQRIADAAVQS